jgi:hypothetical protein
VVRLFLACGGLEPGALGVLRRKTEADVRQRTSGRALTAYGDIRGQMAVLMRYAVRSGMRAVQSCMRCVCTILLRVAIRCLMFSICFGGSDPSMYTSNSQ